MVTDPIANFLNKIKNAINAQKEVVIDPYSTMKQSIAEIMARNDYVKNLEEQEEADSGHKVIVVHLNPDRDKLNVKRVSKPGQRIYRGWKEIRKVRNGFGIGIYSTSQGILTDGEARKLKIGGEYICELY
jgi:small subunit ribosomal protein S8